MRHCVTLQLQQITGLLYIFLPAVRIETEPRSGPRLRTAQLRTVRQLQTNE